jgi:hypothetical protein
MLNRPEATTTYGNLSLLLSLAAGSNHPSAAFGIALDQLDTSIKSGSGEGFRTFVHSVSNSQGSPRWTGILGYPVLEQDR